MSLMGSLGLDSVEADPNSLADGPYKGVISKSEIFVSEKKNTVNHVVTVKVTEGPRKGASKQVWFALGTDPQYDGTPANRLVGMTPTMSEGAKTWYKKFWVDCGIPEAEVGTSEPERLVGINVSFVMRTKDGWQNVVNVQKRDEAPAPSVPAGPAGAL